MVHLPRRGVVEMGILGLFVFSLFAQDKEFTIHKTVFCARFLKALTADFPLPPEIRKVEYLLQGKIKQRKYSITYAGRKDVLPPEEDKEAYQAIEAKRTRFYFLTFGINQNSKPYITIDSLNEDELLNSEENDDLGPKKIHLSFPVVFKVGDWQSFLKGETVELAFAPKAIHFIKDQTEKLPRESDDEFNDRETQLAEGYFWRSIFYKFSEDTRIPEKSIGPVLVTGTQRIIDLGGPDLNYQIQNYPKHKYKNKFQANFPQNPQVKMLTSFIVTGQNFFYRELGQIDFPMVTHGPNLADFSAWLLR